MTTPKYDLDLVDYGTTGWDLILQGLAEDVDNFLHTRILATLGESVDAFSPVYIGSDGRYYNASANAGEVPCRGISIEAGNEDDVIRIARMGPLITDLTFTTGSQLYVSSTAGEISELRPREFAQRIGQAISTSIMFVWIQELSPIHYGTSAPPSPINYLDGTVYFQYDATTTTSTSSTTSTTTTSTTTTTTSSTTSTTTTSTTSTTTSSTTTTTV